MNMTRLPIKKGIEKIMQIEKSSYTRTGVWKIQAIKKYLKLTSEIHHSPVKIPISNYPDVKDAYRHVLVCAKVYKAFIKEGLYHPETQIVICKDEKENLALMVIMPELNTSGMYSLLMKISEKIGSVERKLKLDETCLTGDLWARHRKNTSGLFSPEMNFDS